MELMQANPVLFRFVIAIAVYLFLGLFGAIMAMGKGEHSFWLSVILWPLHLCIQIDDEVVPHYREWRKTGLYNKAMRRKLDAESTLSRLAGGK